MLATTYHVINNLRQMAAALSKKYGGGGTVTPGWTIIPHLPLRPTSLFMLHRLLPFVPFTLSVTMYIHSMCHYTRFYSYYTGYLLRYYKKSIL